MPEITVSMAAGRTDEQKAGMMRDITKALVTNLGVDADAVVIQINEAPLAHKMKGGKTFVERAAAALELPQLRDDEGRLPGPHRGALRLRLPRKPPRRAGPAGCGGRSTLTAAGGCTLAGTQLTATTGNGLCTVTGTSAAVSTATRPSGSATGLATISALAIFGVTIAWPGPKRVPSLASLWRGNFCTIRKRSERST